jgi:apolipoprotein N-acyltransferase
MCIALLTDPEKFAWLIPFTLIGLNGVIAIYPALAALAFRALCTQPGGWSVLLFASVWTLFEYARGHLLTGFPWNLPGYAWGGSDAVMQAASVIGIYGLSFVTVLAAAMPALLLYRRRAWIAVLLCIGALAGTAAWGNARVAAADALPEAERSVPGVQLRLVQGNIAQHHKWDAARQMNNLQTYVSLSQSAGFDSVTHVIWPETAIPYVLNERPSLQNLLVLAVPQDGVLVSGTLRSEGSDEEGDWRIWNSLVVLDRDGVVSSYDKHHLVPFGEFVPLRAVLPIDKITPGAVDFSRGPGPRHILLTERLRVSPLICYEAIFSGEAVDHTEASPPQALLNITNDAWFGDSSGPHQHLAMSRFRAVEQGVPLIRAANTGISVVTDAYGRVQAALALNREGVLDSVLPVSLEGGTPYGRLGDMPVLLLSGLIALSALVRRKISS